MQIPKWQYDEETPAGVDYRDLEEVEQYDRDHQRFRNYERDSEAILQALKLGGTDRVIDLGCGTGAFSLYAARRCAKVYAVDVSKTMLENTARKAKREGLNNIVFCKGGFLTYEHAEEPVEAVVSTAVLHHLPDFWKQAGLLRVAKMLKPGGLFYLMDVIFSFPPEEYAGYFDRWIEQIRQQAGDSFADEHVVVHLKKEYSTFTWVMEGMLARAGFSIVDAKQENGILASYTCRKK